MKHDIDYPEIERYARYLSTSQKQSILSDKTANDLNFEELFAYLNLTTSKVGQQYFYAKLRSNELTPYQDRHEAITQHFSTNSGFAQETEKQLIKLSKNDAYSIISLFTKPLPTVTKLYYFLINVLRFVPFICAGLTALFPSQFFFILTFVSLIVNALFHYSNKSLQIPFQNSIPQLMKLHKVCQVLVKEPRFDSISADVPNALESLKPINKISSLFRVEQLLQSELAALAWLIMELFRILFLTEPYLFHKTIKLINGKQGEIETLYSFVGEIDSLLAIANIRKLDGDVCLPSIDEQNDRLSFFGLYHPLIEGCVTNDLAVRDASILLTGSNMSGKSTFIRSVGVNTLLAQNINTCFAKEFKLKRRLTLQSMITVGDDLINSKSLFFEEVLSVKEMLDACETGQHLFLLDEIFKGTNTLERVAAAKAVLAQLIKNDNLVFVSTHDIELAELLYAEYALYHFCEHISSTEVAFDYLLKPGKLTSFNAIKILKMSGYPDALIQDAYDTISQWASKDWKTNLQSNQNHLN